MTSDNQPWFQGVESVITEPLRFKAKLAIGEDAYQSLKLKNAVLEVWDSLGAATAAAAVAKSSVVATTFFSSSGFLAAIGIGTATTPVGWVIAAGVVAGGSWMGVARYLKGMSKSRVTVIPDFINTPMDILALTLFDLIAPLALKVATIDDKVNDAERACISRYFVHEWGYDADFVEHGVGYTLAGIDEFSIVELATSLAEFKKSNPDCHYKAMSNDILTFIVAVMNADGVASDAERDVIKQIEGVFSEVSHNVIKKMARKGWRKLSATARKLNRFHS